MAIQITRTLYVGLGGTGVSTLLKIKKCFLDSYGEIPPMIGFLAIDTNNAVSTYAVTSKDGQQVRLSANELLTISVPSALQVYKCSPQVYEWVPTKNVQRLSTIAGNGAGQVRSNGRFITYFNETQIRTNIQGIVGQIHKMPELGSRFMPATSATNNGQIAATRVNVIGSVAGGTGSGTLIDVLCIVKEAMKQSGVRCELFPWVVLPDVFKAMSTGPAMYNVEYNAIGALRELDYIQHHDPNTPPINMGHSQIGEPLFEYAYIINKMNRAGASFGTTDELLDSVARSAFIPANEMGTDVASTFDNIIALKGAGTFDILNKKAWAASASSAELIYDKEMVARSYAYTIMKQMCVSLIAPSSNGSADANSFVDDPDVMIRENNGRDDVINHLIPSVQPEYTLPFDKETTADNVKMWLQQNCAGAAVCSEQTLTQNMNAKLSKAKAGFNKKLAEIMGRQQAPIGSGISFVEALRTLIAICLGEMQDEEKVFKANVQRQIDWDAEVRAIKPSGMVGFFKSIDQDRVDDLTSMLTSAVADYRELMRRQWAINFYNSFDQFLQGELKQLHILEQNVKQVSGTSENKLLYLQNNAKSASKFEISLHEHAVKNVDKYVVDDSVKAAFVQHFAQGCSQWIGKQVGDIDTLMFNFAKTTTPVQAALADDIETVLQRMTTQDVRKYLQHLCTLSEPLWTYNTQGYNSQVATTDRFFVVGVPNRNKTILQSPEYNDLFSTVDHQASFSSTNQNDRIYLLQIEDLLPIYAVDNVKAYKSDEDAKLAQGFSLSNYIDEKLHNRMMSEDFKMWPVLENDNALHTWVTGIILGKIHFDTEKGVYWVVSRKNGKAISKYRYDLNKQRDVAYDLFRSLGISREMEEEINKEIATNGSDSFKNKILEAKEDYYENRCQLSPIEREQIEEPKFKAVLDLVTREIDLLQDMN